MALGAILAGAIQELDTQANKELAELREDNQQLRSQIAELKEQVGDRTALEERLTQLEAMLLEDLQVAEAEQ